MFSLFRCASAELRAQLGDLYAQFASSVPQDVLHMIAVEAQRRAQILRDEAAAKGAAAGAQ